MDIGAAGPGGLGVPKAHQSFCWLAVVEQQRPNHEAGFGIARVRVEDGFGLGERLGAIAVEDVGANIVEVRGVQWLGVSRRRRRADGTLG